jgi:predicted ATPase
MTMHGVMSVSAARPALEVTGREAEMGLLATFLREDPGRPTALVLQGEAGIGKTTILRAALERAQPSDLRVLAIRLSAGEAELPFAALADLIEETGDEGLAALAPPQRPTTIRGSRRTEVTSPPTTSGSRIGSATDVTTGGG